MISFSIKTRTLGLMSLGWSHPSALGTDVPFARRGVVVEEKTAYEIYIPGSSFKGALRSAASRVAEAYGFSSCKEVKPELIEQKHASSSICDVCTLFGYPKSNTPSPLMVSDLKPEKGVETIEVARIRIDDFTLKVAEGALFTVEYVPPNVVFEGKVYMTEVNKQDLLGLLLLSMAELRMDRLGHSSMIDLKIEEGILKEKLRGTKWLALVEDLKEWLWK